MGFFCSNAVTISVSSWSLAILIRANGSFLRAIISARRPNLMNKEQKEHIIPKIMQIACSLLPLHIQASSGPSKFWASMVLGSPIFSRERSTRICLSTEYGECLLQTGSNSTRSCLNARWSKPQIGMSDFSQSVPKRVKNAYMEWFFLARCAVLLVSSRKAPGAKLPRVTWCLSREESRRQFARMINSILLLTKS